MGNTSSSSADQETQKYKDYIEQQQKIILTQQQQLQQQQTLQQQTLQHQTRQQHNTARQPDTQGMPSNVFFEQKVSQQQRLKKLQEKEKLNPYKIIGVPKDYSELQLKKAYLEKAMIAHPDKGGSEREFQKISIAYTFLLTKLKESGDIHEHHELREHNQGFVREQNGSNSQNINLSEKFDKDVFNQIYEDNKVSEAHEDGYGEWMKQETNPSLDTNKLFSGKFNKDMFHNEFDKFKQGITKQSGNQIQKHQDPEVSISYKGKDSIMVLGQKKIDDFSGQSDGGLAYRDYKDAYTNSCLIDVHTVNSRGRPTSLNEEKSQRANISYQMDAKDEEQYQLKKLQEEHEEKERIERLRNYESKAFAMHDKIHQRMLGK